MTLAVLAATLTLVLPSTQADSGSCSGSTRLTGLDSLWVYFTTATSNVRQVAFSGPEHGREGQEVSIVLPGPATTTWAETNRIGSRVHSCASPYIGVNLGVPVVPRVRLPEMWIDAAGRASRTRPRMPGIYMHRRPDGTVGKDVVL